MTSVERVLIALDHQKPDRVPRLLYGEVIGYVPAIRDLLAAGCGGLLPRKYFDMDITGVGFNPTRIGLERFRPWYEDSFETAAQSGQLDEWGVYWKQGSCYHFAEIQSPLKEAKGLSDIEAYPWPDLDQAYRFEGLKERVALLHAEGIAVAGFAGSIFEQAWYLRGMENLLMDMLADKDMARALVERTAAFQKRCAVELARAGVDIILTGDDVAAQESLMMSKATWREFLRPLLADTIAAAKDARKEVKLFYHSDGRINELIPELIDIGVDILNPLQPECLDPAEIKRMYGDRLCFWGSVSVQRTMPFGTPEDVMREVRLRIETVGESGGFILAPAHVLGPETPWENIAAFFEAADKSGGS